MYHDMHKFGKAYQEEMQRMAGASGMHREQGRKQSQSKARGVGVMGALSGLLLLGLFIAMVAIRIM